MPKKTVVIVGSGTAGLVIAKNLFSHFNVILLEKSKYKAYPTLFKIPMFIGFLFRSKTQKYIKKREIKLNSGRKIPFYESKVFGGASVINGCVHTIGMRSIWETILARFSSEYENLEDGYKNLYSKNGITESKINITEAEQTLVDKAFIQTLGVLGISMGDMDYSNAQNCGQINNTCNKIFRSSVLSLINKTPLNISLNEKALKLLVNGDECVSGVITNKRIIKSDYVILSAGVIGTNTFLMNQVIDDGKKATIPPIGLHRIQDHVNLRINVISHEEIGSFNEIEKSMLKKIKIFSRHLMCMPNLLRGTGATSGVHLDLDGDGLVDVRIQVVQFTESGRHGSDGRYFGDNPGFSLSITPINPYSKGKIDIVDGKVIIDPDYLSDERDVNLLVKSLEFGLNLLRTEPITSYVKEIVSLQEIQSNPRKYIEENFFSGHHLIGGVGDKLDENFKLKNYSNLYACDASVFQEYPASNIHSSVVLLADIFAKKFIANNVTHS